MFITIEGIDGCGKSTQARLLAERLSEEHSLPVVRTKEPGGWQGGFALRSLLLEGQLAHPLSELFLFLADRGEHVRQCISPSLISGKTVLCERYSDSTLAYQSWGRGLPLDRMEELLRWADFPLPDVTFYIDIPVETALRRIKGRGPLDRFEKEGGAFLQRVRSGFRALSAREPGRIVSLDGEMDIRQLSDLMLRETLRRYADTGAPHGGS